MVVGDGMIACAFKPHFGDDSNVVVFATGVANIVRRLCQT